jgi:YHS domain-containing protein
MSYVTSYKAWIGAAMFALVSLTAGAGEFYEKDGVAIKGFDAVSYFKTNKAVKGSDQYTARYKDSTFHFSSAENRDTFSANPEQYAPQYNGFCAYGVAKGAKAKIEGESFAIVDGKLYLNYDAKVQSDWQKDITGYVKKADINWPDVSTQSKVVQ